MGMRVGIRQEEKNQLVTLLVAGYSWVEAKASIKGVEPTSLEKWRGWATDEAKARKAATPDAPPDENEALAAELEKAKKENADLKAKLDFLGGDKPGKK